MEGPASRGVYGALTIINPDYKGFWKNWVLKIKGF